MGARLVLFIFFLSIVTFFLTLTSYKKYFNSEEDLSREHLQKTVKEYKAQQEALLAGPQESRPEEEAGGMDMNDPVIKQGMLVYNEKGNCYECHGEKGEGNPEKKGPLIAGQHDWYVIDQIKQMKAGQRVNQDMMPYLEKIDENDIKAVAKYIKYLRAD